MGGLHHPNRAIGFTRDVGARAAGRERHAVGNFKIFDLHYYFIRCRIDHIQVVTSAIGLVDAYGACEQG